MRVRTADFDFELPPELIAQQPATQRDQSRLLVVHRQSGLREHRRFPELAGYLKPGDVLVFNNSRVIPARLRGVNAKTGGAFEILLLEENARNDWWAMMKPGKRARAGTQIKIRNPKSEIRNLTATVTGTNDEGHRRLTFSGTDNILNELEALGEIPLPPYIARDEQHHADRERYQTVYAQAPGSVAAPTAGLHFTEPLLEKLRTLGVETHFVTLHVGLGTFAPVKAETLAAHTMHEERFEVSDATARAVNAAKHEGRRVIAVGTTSVRVLESAAIPTEMSAIAHLSSPKGGESRGEEAQLISDQSHMRLDQIPSPQPPPRLGGERESGTNARSSHPIRSGAGRTNIFIHPPRDFKIVDALLTNFHLPCSTLLMLVSAFAAPGELRGRELIRATYAEAVRERYRFFSYGDAMLIL